MRTVPGPSENVVVVGAGFGGLSAALRLAAAGRSVTVIERHGRADRGRVPRVERGRLPPVRGVRPRVERTRAARIHRPQPRRRARPDAPVRGTARRARRVAPARSQDRRVFHRRAAAADLLVPVDVAGLAPTRALAIFAVIAYMDSVAGVYYPRGGLSAVADALAGAAARHGVRFRYGTTAARIEVNGGRARAVITADGERIAADAIVVNADLPTAYHQLLPVEYTPRRVARLAYSPSCVVLHVGSSAARTDDAPHH